MKKAWVLALVFGCPLMACAQKPKPAAPRATSAQYRAALNSTNRVLDELHAENEALHRVVRKQHKELARRRGGNK